MRNQVTIFLSMYSLLTTNSAYTSERAKVHRCMGSEVSDERRTFQKNATIEHEWFLNTLKRERDRPDCRTSAHDSFTSHSPQAIMSSSLCHNVINEIPFKASDITVTQFYFHCIFFLYLAMESNNKLHVINNEVSCFS